MQKIIKKTSFFKKYLYYIFATFWLIFGAYYYFLSEGKGAVFISVLYLIAGLLHALVAFKQGGKNAEYIAWDEEKVIVARLHQKPKAYYFSSEVNIHLSNYNLIIKAPRATGDMVELKGFTEEDLDLLREKFANPAVA